MFYAHTLADDGIKVNALAPGLRRTDLNASAGPPVQPSRLTLSTRSSSSPRGPGPIGEVAQLAGHAVPGVGLLRDPPRMHFMDNLDPESFATLLARLPLATSRFVAISKSGGTGETLMQCAAVLAALRAEKLTVPVPAPRLSARA